jgi:hypothetical protein
VDGVGKRADDGDGLDGVLLERKERVFVLEQDDGFERHLLGDGLVAR